jgi:hypothetical protein
MLISNKKNNILSGKIIMTIDSSVKKVNKNIINLLVITILAVSIFTVIAVFIKYRDILITSLCIAVIFGICSVLLIIVFYLTNRGASLVFTDKGLCMGNYIAELWGDISGYNYVVYDKLDKWTLANLVGGTSLVIYNHGVFQRSINMRGHSLIAVNGVFLSKEQISNIDEIFAGHNIPIK